MNYKFIEYSHKERINWTKEMVSDAFSMSTNEFIKKYPELKRQDIGIKEYVEKLIEQADILQALIEIEGEDISIEMKSRCNYLIGYIHALKKE